MATEEKLQTLTPKQKAAMILWFLDEETAAGIIDTLPDADKQTLAQEMVQTKNYNLEGLADVMWEFLNELQGGNIHFLGFDGEQIKRLFKNMPPEKLDALMKDIKIHDDDPFDFLRSISDVPSLLTILNEESPQTIAMVLSYVKPDVASELLENLPEEKMIDTTVCIARLEQFDSEIINNVSGLLRVKLDTMAYSSINKTDGIKNVANILNNVSRSTERAVFEYLDGHDNSLANLVRQQMFIFEDILLLDDITLQKVLAEIQDNILVVKAMKGEKEEIKEKIYSCVSKTRKDLLLEELEVLGPIKVTEVEKAQQEITHLIKELERKGKIVILRGDEDALI